MQDVRWLSQREAAAWHAVRYLGQPLWTALGRDLQRDSGLSMADYHVLVVLSESDNGALPYRAVADATGWEKSRLSHHITRMQRRGLVHRAECIEDGRSATIVLSAAGRAAIESAAPSHVESVRRLLVDLLTPSEIDALISVGAKVAQAVEASEATVPRP